MSQVQPVRSGTVVLSGVFEKITTEGDSSNFLGSNAGLSQLFRATEDTGSSVDHSYGVLVTDVDSVTDGYGNTLYTYDFTLDFNYLVGAKQLIVQLKTTPTATQPVAGFVTLPSKELIDTDPAANAWDPYYEEIDSTTVRVHNILDSRIILALIPHTAIPATNKEKITVQNQGNNEAIELEGAGDGVIFRTPNGSRWLFRIDDSGTTAIVPR